MSSEPQIPKIRPPKFDDETFDRVKGNSIGNRKERKKEVVINYREIAKTSLKALLVALVVVFSAKIGFRMKSDQRAFKDYVKQCNVDIDNVEICSEDGKYLNRDGLVSEIAEAIKKSFEPGSDYDYQDVMNVFFMIVHRNTHIFNKCFVPSFTLAEYNRVYDKLSHELVMAGYVLPRTLEDYLKMSGCAQDKVLYIRTDGSLVIAHDDSVSTYDAIRNASSYAKIAAVKGTKKAISPFETDEQLIRPIKNIKKR